MTVADESGQVIGSCTTMAQGTNASCTVPGVPYFQYITVTQDVATLPANVESDDTNPIIIYTATPAYDTSAPGDPGYTASFYNRLIEPIPIGDSVASDGAAEPEQQPTKMPPAAMPATIATLAPITTQPDATEPVTAATDGSNAAIYAGDCDSDFTDEPVTTLTNVRPSDGNTAGAGGASAVETSFTTLDLPLDDILAEDHVLVVFDEDDDTVPLVCGAIGGVVAEDGSLAFGLPVVGESRFSGVAYLTPDGDQTLATIFLAEDLSSDETPAA